MIVAIHQPNYLPWMGYFYKMAKADVFVILDSVQYAKRTIGNRVKIKTTAGNSGWLTLPVKTKGEYYQKVDQVVLYEFFKWRDNHLKTIRFNYEKAPYFDWLFPELQKVMDRDWTFLWLLNVELVKLMNRLLRIDTTLIRSSVCHVHGKGNELLINLCRTLGADEYLSGDGASGYQREEEYDKAGIRLEYTNFVPPEYPQLWGEFVSGLSIIDLLFNCGSGESRRILLKESS